MARKVWEFKLQDGKHTVELERSYWSHKKTITVAGLEITLSHKKTWEFTLDDGKHTVELERGYWSHKRTITVDGVEIMLSGWYPVDLVVHFEVGGVPCVLDPIHLWVRGKLVGEEKALRERIRQRDTVRKTAGYGQEQKAGVFTKIKDFFTDDYPALATKALLQRLHSLGVEVEFYDERTQMAKLAGQSIDGVIMITHSELRDYECAHYVVFSMRDKLARRLKAKSRKVKEHKLWGKVLNVRWVGGPVARLLNSDVDLLQLQIEEGQIEIEIRPDKINQWVRIAAPYVGRGRGISYTYTTVPGFPGVASESLPSRETFNLYNRIAQHIRQYMAQ